MNTERASSQRGKAPLQIDRLDAATRLALGQIRCLEADVRRLHWFDPRTGENIGLDDAACETSPEQTFMAPPTHGCRP